MTRTKLHPKHVPRSLSYAKHQLTLRACSFRTRSFSTLSLSFSFRRRSCFSPLCAIVVTSTEGKYEMGWLQVRLVSPCVIALIDNTKDNRKVEYDYTANVGRHLKHSKKREVWSSTVNVTDLVQCLVLWGGERD